MTEQGLCIENLSASIAGKPILRGVTLRVGPGEVHALMGPNGSGKSTLSNVLLDHPDTEVTGGSIRFNGVDLLPLPTEERARLGLFLSFQYPVALPGVTVARFLKAAVDSIRGAGVVKASTFLKEIREQAAFLDIGEGFLNRALNDGFSGGEKKRMEILQMLALRPALAILDETDSGLDIDALQVVARGVHRLIGPEFGLLVITHYERILRYIQPQTVHILIDGRVVTSGGPDLVTRLEAEGYDWLRNGNDEDAANR
ncbi:MAG: Fe-S cluster assembly ATPase SufC [Kiritimatiellia bacterium]|nr:Fe-S cluster assembly ATPase SufC [Kiritimatiellia bacterium]